MPDKTPAIHPKGDVKAATITYSIAIILALSWVSTRTTCIESSSGLIRDILQASKIILIISRKYPLSGVMIKSISLIANKENPISKGFLNLKAPILGTKVKKNISIIDERIKGKTPINLAGI